MYLRQRCARVPTILYVRLHGRPCSFAWPTPSAVWEILKQAGLDPTPERASTAWADFLNSQADALSARWEPRSPERQPGHPGDQESGDESGRQAAGRAPVRDRDRKPPARVRPPITTVRARSTRTCGRRIRREMPTNASVQLLTSVAAFSTRSPGGSVPRISRRRRPTPSPGGPGRGTKPSLSNTSTPNSRQEQDGPAPAE